MIRNNLLYIGIFCVLIVASFMTWVKHQVAYDHIRHTAMAKFTLVEKITNKPFMPTIEIAGPKGEIVLLPEKGKFMFINLWSVKCKECISNLNALKNLRYIFLRNNKNWKIISVCIDKPEDLEQVSRIIKKYNISELAEYYDADKTLRKLIAPQTIPVTIIVSDDGRILYKIHGKAPWIDPDITTFLLTMLHVKDK